MPTGAGASAAAVSQPSLGASLRKGWFRMIGTLTGAIFIVVLTACFVQNRTAFLIGLALWGGACALVATLLRNFASYAAALAGFTAVIVASDELGATGGATGSAFMFAVTRAGEICIGIACAGVILAATDFGGARRRLATVLATLTQEISSQFVATLTTTDPKLSDTQPIRREFIRQVIALDPTIDQAIGESSQLAPQFISPAAGGVWVDRRAGRMANRRESSYPTVAGSAAAARGRQTTAKHSPGAARGARIRRCGELDGKSRGVAASVSEGGARLGGGSAGQVPLGSY